MKILLIGSFNRIGGVTRSTKNLYEALLYKKIKTTLISKSFFWKIKMFDFAHIHASKDWKIFIGLVLGKLFAKRTIFTLHGNYYKKSFFNLLNIKLIDGIIFLNKKTSDKYKYYFKSIILNSIFKEGFIKQKIQKKILKKKSKKIYLLIYAYDKIIINNKDVYGVDFILNNLNNFEKKYVIILVDPKSAYKSDIKKDYKNLTYINYYLDFFTLLKEIDIYVRPTSSDGDSVAIHEALILRKKIIASNVVDRPKGIQTYKYNNFKDFYSKLKILKKNKYNYKLQSIDSYINFLKKITNE